MPALKKNLPKHTYSGDQWLTMSTNKKYLANDFDHRCAYCDDHDQYNGGKQTYQVDHFAPVSKFPELKHTYENLMYACPYCNGSKRDTWVSDNAAISVVDSEGFISPCSKEYSQHLVRNDNGTISATTPLGEYMHRHLKLYLQRHSIIYSLDRIDELCDLIEAKIGKDEKAGVDVTKLRCIHSQITTQLRKYYKALYNAK